MYKDDFSLWFHYVQKNLPVLFCILFSALAEQKEKKKSSKKNTSSTHQQMQFISRSKSPGLGRIVSDHLPGLPLLHPLGNYIFLCIKICKQSICLYCVQYTCRIINVSPFYVLKEFISLLPVCITN
jgi:hypothetical protein